MTTDSSGFYLKNRLIQISQTGGLWYSDTSPFRIPWFVLAKPFSAKFNTACLIISFLNNIGARGFETKARGVFTLRAPHYAPSLAPWLKLLTGVKQSWLLCRVKKVF
jgi:hypothetical protein